MDSNCDSCALLVVLFAQYGINTTTAFCISEALEMIQQTPPDLLIGEIILPDGDGYSLIRQVKALEATYGLDIPAIALTVCAKQSDRNRALAAGFCRHLTKPINIDELITTIAYITGEAQQSQQMPVNSKL
ncbi:MAG: response regulator [Nostoc sp. ChiSLP02]|nr:response regulator [Nostoc sp. DedSLP05]MDZ8098670.1 response regulator [Nostoc sp. DedSLP01]MDZ8183717.1 response regulator [Nostoc sp. ChiSLP02]